MGRCNMEILLFATLARQVRHEHIKITRVEWCVVHACARGGVRPAGVLLYRIYRIFRFRLLQSDICVLAGSIININIICSKQSPN
jgi:hypothetical protein